MVGIFRSEVLQAREAMGPSARPWERTGSIDVEALAEWAFSVQMVDRFERVGLHAIEAEAAGFEITRQSSDGCGQLMQIEHLGCRIDRSSVNVSDTVHPAAFALAACLGAVENGWMVKQFALAGARPTSWIEPEAKARASVWVKVGEKAQVEYQGPGRKGAYCPVILLWDDKRADWGRLQYRMWWQALVDLGWQLSMRALGFTVTGPAAPAEPWIDAGAADRKRAEASSISLDLGRGQAPP